MATVRVEAERDDLSRMAASMRMAARELSTIADRMSSAVYAELWIAAAAKTGEDVRYHRYCAGGLMDRAFETYALKRDLLQHADALEQLIARDAQPTA